MPTITGPIKKKSNLQSKPLKVTAKIQEQKGQKVASHKLTWEIYYASCPLHCPILQGKLFYNGAVIGDMNVIQSLQAVALPLIRSLGIEVTVMDPPYIPDKAGAEKLRKQFKLGRV